MDQDLVVGAQRGDQRAFERLTAANHPRLFRVAYGILRNRHLAEDATQEAFIEIWRSIRRLRDPSRFEAWSYRLLVRSCYAEARRHPPMVLDDTVPSFEAGVTRDDYATIIDRDQLDRGFRRLSLEHRTVIVLRCLLDLPMGQVAEVLGVAPGTVGSRLSRALAALRAALEADSRPIPPAITQAEVVR
jgi:RNA polymerase sigma-70 factor (ECF subfamily)